ncbi:MAG: enoyl-CoA hydratase-related protein [Deltaproteobacteria bacterium]|nr:enoyl-CoA hydratase-related protein [Deltaproteobacteria bacterium]
MSDYETLLVEKDGAVAVVTINRPDKLNALNAAVIRDLGEAFAALEADASVKAVVLTGAGEKAFVAGADISEMKDYGPSEGVAFAQQGQRVFDRIQYGPKPVIAAVNGFALGGGTELAMACDFIYASAKAKFGQPEINLGIIPGFGGTQRLPRLVGRGRALELILTGDMLPADEAYRIGLVNKVVPPEELLAEAKKTAVKMASKGAVALKFAKHSINRGLDTDMDGGQRIEAESFGELCATEDKKEGMTAFLEKRAPKFQDK